MRVLVCCDSFKGTLTSEEACRTVKEALLKTHPSYNVSICPVADGGEGTVEAMCASLGGEKKTVVCKGPLLAPVNAVYCLAGETAVMEMSAASGITLVEPDELDPFRATTYGTGEMMRHAIENGARRIIIGIGGSATNDCGAGALSALGVRFFNESGEFIPLGADSLDTICDIDVSALEKLLENIGIYAACDVTSPLLGKSGATMMFSRQKGAKESDFPVLEEKLASFAEKSKSILGFDGADMPGAGAAGGLGFALTAYCGAKLRPGFDIIADAVGLEEKIGNSDVIITGEGKTDESSLLGKLPVSVSRLAHKAGKKCVLISGDIDCAADTLGQHFERSFKARFDGESPAEAMANARERLFTAALKASETI